MPLSKQAVLSFRSRGHHLKPVVTIGHNGVTDAVIREIDLSLAHHELMKIKVNTADREGRDAQIALLCNTLNAELIQTIGRVALLYRPRPEE